MPPKPAKANDGDAQDEMPWVNEAWHNANPARSKYSLQQWKAHLRSLSGDLSFTLRFGAKEQGIQMRAGDAFVAVREFLEHRKHRGKGYSIEDIGEVVANCPKQRFSTCTDVFLVQFSQHEQENTLTRLKGELDRRGVQLDEEKELESQGIELKDKDGWPLAFIDLRLCPRERFPIHVRLTLGEMGFIRCQQGHDSRKLGIALDRNIMHRRLTKHNCPPMAVHGTFENKLENIKKQGLIRGRDDIHMAASLPQQTQSGTSGCRAYTNYFLHIDIRGAVDAGIRFWLSDNRVILTPGNDDGCLPPRFIRGCTDETGKHVIFGFDQDLKGGYPVRTGVAQEPPKLETQMPSDLSVLERDFLKAVKNFRAILKIEAQQDSGERVEKTQLDKLAKKSEFLDKLREAEQKLPTNSEQRAKNQDVLSHLTK